VRLRNGIGENMIRTTKKVTCDICKRRVDGDYAVIRTDLFRLDSWEEWHVGKCCYKEAHEALLDALGGPGQVK
jgi:hypothetical protein